jgi:FkbM family methyltransferase
MRRTLNKISPTGYTQVSISSGGAQGLKMLLDMQTEKDYWLGTYETDLQEVIKDHIQDGWVVYDVGANIGFITLLLSRLVGDDGIVFAFEALPENIARLEKNLALNALNTRVKVIPFAVVDTPKTVTFLVGPSGAMGKVMGSAGRENIHLKSFQIPGISLDDFIYQNGNPPPQLVKMDIEGGEVLAIKGMPRLLAEERPIVFLEMHGTEAARGVWDTLITADYRIYQMTPDLPRISSFNELDWKSYVVAFP